ncbi:hypothetical protein EXIGLDRAFT_776258 [Exidia glandulosa HHB12029]|uniref:Uncharacterized protein n=1 Tax=Exidia glandulosa HHB12029 TaxID=1314781 RepID=A0A165DJ89_EXIGL|nr:hypothetical protein EXIGLDRAFT_776258 [Exidia glandulosa HHB12029]
MRNTFTFVNLLVLVRTQQPGRLDLAPLRMANAGEAKQARGRPQKAYQALDPTEAGAAPDIPPAQQRPFAEAPAAIATLQRAKGSKKLWGHCYLLLELQLLFDSTMVKSELEKQLETLITDELKQRISTNSPPPDKPVLG